MISSPTSLVLRSRSAESITNDSASFTICSSLLIGTGRFSQARRRPFKTFFRSAIFLYDHIRYLVDPLIRGKALAALQTLAPTTDRLGFLALARVHHFIFRKTA